MRQVPVPARHQRAVDPRLALAHADVVEEVVRVHHGRLGEERLDGVVVPAILGKATLREERGDELGPTCGGLGALVDVRPGHQTLREGVRLGAEHRCAN